MTAEALEFPARRNNFSLRVGGSFGKIFGQGAREPGRDCARAGAGRLGRARERAPAGDQSQIPSWVDSESQLASKLVTDSARAGAGVREVVRASLVVCRTQ